MSVFVSIISYYFRYLDLILTASEGPIWHVHSSQNGQHETHHEPDMDTHMEQMEDMEHREEMCNRSDGWETRCIGSEKLGNCKKKSVPQRSQLLPNYSQVVRKIFTP